MVENQITTTTADIGTRLLSYKEGGFILPFEVMSILLLAVMIGAIVIAKGNKLNSENEKEYMIEGISIYEILTVTSILFFIGIYGFITRKNLISVLISIELVMNASVMNFVVINKYLYPEMLQGVIFAIFIIAVTAAETALAVSIIINIYRQISSVEVKDTETMKY